MQVGIRTVVLKDFWFLPLPDDSQLSESLLVNNYNLIGLPFSFLLFYYLLLLIHE